MREFFNMMVVYCTSIYSVQNRRRNIVFFFATLNVSSSSFMNTSSTWCNFIIHCRFWAHSINRNINSINRIHLFCMAWPIDWMRWSLELARYNSTNVFIYENWREQFTFRPNTFPLQKLLENCKFNLSLSSHFVLVSHVLSRFEYNIIKWMQYCVCVFTWFKWHILYKFAEYHAHIIIQFDSIQAHPMQRERESN